MKLFLLILILIWLNPYITHAQEDTHAHQNSSQSIFLENKGQWPKDVLFKSKMSGGNLWLQTNKLIYHLQDFSSLRENHFSRSRQSSTSIKEKLIHL